MGFNISDIFDGKAEQAVLDDVVSWGQGVIKAVEANPAVQTAVTTFQNDASAAVSDVAAWAGTAADAALSTLGQNIQSAVASELLKYGAAVGISASGPLGVAEAVALQGAVAVAKAAVSAAVTAAVPAPAA